MHISIQENKIKGVFFNDGRLSHDKALKHILKEMMVIKRQGRTWEEERILYLEQFKNSWKLPVMSKVTCIFCLAGSTDLAALQLDYRLAR